MSQKIKLEALTGMRFWAALYIVFFHQSFVFADFAAPVRNLVNNGYASVSLFFILSGFILAYNYIDPSGEKPLEPQQFWIARFARIYPVYVLSIILLLPFIIDKIIRTSSGVEAVFKTSEEIFRLGVSAALLQAWTPWTCCEWNWPAWALSTEVFLYLLFPFIAVYVAKLNNTQIVFSSVAFWLISLIAPVAYLVILPDGINYNFYSFWFRVLTYNPLFHLPQFLVGVGAGVIFSGKNSRSQNHTANAKFALFASSVILPILVLFAAKYNPPYIGINNGLLAPFFVILIYGMAYGGGILAKFLALPGFAMLGEASYALYILQNPIKMWIESINKRFFDLEPDSVLLFVIYICILVPISILVLHAVENPARKKVKEIISNYISRQRHKKA